MLRLLATGLASIALVGSAHAATVDIEVTQTAAASLYVGAAPVVLTTTVTVDNLSADTDAHDVGVIVAGPAGATYVTSDGSCTESAGDVTCDLGVVVAGGQTSFVVTWEIAGGTQDDLLFDVVVVTSDEDPDAANDSDSDLVAVLFCGDDAVTDDEDCDDGGADGGCAATCAGCDDGWADGSGVWSCDTCAAGFYGAVCAACPSGPGGVCNGHGTCDGSGTTGGTGACTCTTGFISSGGVCDACATGYGGPSCTFCPGGALTPCSGHGTCLGSGDIGAAGVSCSCDPGYSNLDCSNACGDGVTSAPEACDDAGESATCNADCTQRVCGDGKVNPTGGEECDDGDAGGDGCAAGPATSCTVEAGYTCAADGNCSADCGTFYDFGVVAGNWRASGTAGTGRFAWGAASSVFGGGQTGWETGLGVALPGGSTFSATLWRKIAFAPASAAPRTHLKVSYRLDNDADCVNIWISPTAAYSTGTKVFAECVHGDPTELRLADVAVPASALGTTQWVTLELAASAQPTTRAGLLVTKVEVASDSDGDASGIGANAGWDFKTLACGDGCVDRDLDGYGDATSRNNAGCADAAVDCLDDLASAHPKGNLAVWNEDCSNLIDNDCQNGAGGADPFCAEDCGNFVDDAAVANSAELVDCQDPVCDLALLTDPPPNPDRAPMCSTPCLMTWDFNWGKSFVIDATATGLFSFSTATKLWQASGGSAGQAGRISLVVPFGVALDQGPAPRLNVDYLVSGTSELLVCVASGGSAPSACVATAPNCNGTATACKVNLTSAATSASIDLQGWLGTANLRITFAYLGGGTGSASVSEVSLGSDADNDGLYEGTDRNYPDDPGTPELENRLVCDPCWDRDFDFFGDVASPDLTQCQAFLNDPLNPVSLVPDCDDTRNTVRPDLGIETSCSDGLDNDCDGDTDAFDGDCGSEDCANGIDDNGDGTIDCNDPTCAGNEGEGRLPNPACDPCYTGFNFVVGDTGGASGWVASGRLGLAVKNDVFAVGRSVYHGTQLSRGVFGWETQLDAMVGAAGAGRVRGWLQRSISVPSTMSEAALEIVYHFDGDNDGEHAWGVCFNVPSATACALSQPANVTWSSNEDTVPTGAPTVPEVDPNTGIATFTDGYFRHVVVPFPNAGSNTVYLFFDSQTATDLENGAVRGLFIDEIRVRSDADFDANAADGLARTGYENFDPRCDHCVDRDKDGYGDAQVVGADLTTCAVLPRALDGDCDDHDAATHPGINYIDHQDGTFSQSEKAPVDYCYRPQDSPRAKDNTCDGVIDSLDPACRVCGNGIIDLGESCDDGPGDLNPVSGDGCTGLNDPKGPCRIETGGLYVTEIHLPILFGNPAEQWVEFYNATSTTFDLQSLQFELVIGACPFNETTRVPDNLALCRRLKFSGPDAACTFKTTSAIAPNSYYVVNLGPPESAGFANPNGDIDATCTAPVSLAQIGDTLSLILDSGSGPQVADQVRFSEPSGRPSSWACALANFRTVDGRSIMLADPENHSQGSNDEPANWCLAGPGAVNRYANTDRHFGSPGTSGSCGEFFCDGVNDDCFASDPQNYPLGVDEVDGTFLVDPDGDKVCSQPDGQGGYTGVDCQPLVNSCSTGVGCVRDIDGDGYVDCLDGCEDIDGDGHGRSVVVSGSACPGLVDGVVHPSCVTPACAAIDGRTGAEQACEGVAQSFPGNPEVCLDSYDNDCDGFYNCLDSDCTATAECKGETCAAQQETLACGQALSVVPQSTDFPNCTPQTSSGPDKVYAFKPLQAGPVTFIIENSGSRRYELQAYTSSCVQSSCAAATAKAESFCIGGGTLTLPNADPALTYYIVAKQIGACSNGLTPAARLTASCPEICDGGGQDEDADGKIDCADSDCVAPTGGGAPAALCAGLDFDSDGVSNQSEYVCGTSPLVGGQSANDDRFKNPDNDLLLNCVDDDDDNDGASDAHEVASCLNPLSKNNATQYPQAVPPCGSSATAPACFGPAPLVCDVPGIDADCNRLADRTEAACGTKESNCGNNVDDDGDGKVDCADDDCIPDPFCCGYDYDGDNALNCIEIACNTNPREASSVPTALQSGDHDGDTLPNCSDPDDDNDHFSDVEETLCGSDPYDVTSVPADNDGDRQCDAVDQDDDNDNFPDTQESACGSDPFVASSTPNDADHDLDQDAVCDALDDDIDGDGWLNFQEIGCETDPDDAASNPTVLFQDIDNDHLCDRIDSNDDNDGWLDIDEVACGTDKNDRNDFPADCDGDRVCDVLDTDDDGDGAPDSIEILCQTGVCDALSKPLEIDTVDTDLDGLVNCVDDDDDADLIPDAIERAGCPAPVPAPAAGPNCTDTLKKDTDKDGLDDGVEDANHDGLTGPGETSPVRTDTDGDGLSDLVEATSCYPTGEPNACEPSLGWVQDTDGDGILDGFEDKNRDGSLGATETNPIIADSDGDTFSDGEELRCLTNPLSALSVPLDLNGNDECDGAELDTDRDGISDALELFCGTDPLDNGSTPSLRDLQDEDGDTQINCVDFDDDADGFGDVDEIDCGNDPRDDTDAPTLNDIADYDGDGLKNCADDDDDDDGVDDEVELEHGTDPYDRDTDDDGLSDGQEDKLGTDPLDVDTDHDGVQDGTEFSLVEGTVDTDPATFIPDADPSTTTDPKAPDTDDDGLDDGDEDADHNGRVDDGEGDPLDPTDGLRDTDGDGLIDRDERQVWNTDPLDKDTDDDALEDKLEVLVYNTDPNVPDTDGGGVIDGFEVQNGTDPIDPLDDFTEAVISGENVFGCTSGGSGEGAMLFITILGGIFMALRRRFRALGAVLLAVGLVGPSLSEARAQVQTTPVGNVEQFVPGGGGNRIWSVETTQVAPAWKPYVGLLFYGERNSLVLTAGNHTEDLIGNQQVANLQIGIGIADLLQFDVGLPVVVGMASGDTTSTPALSGAGMMDMLIRLRGRIINNALGGFGLGASLGVTVPTGDDDHFRGDPGAGVLFSLLGDFRTGGTVLSLNIGTRIRTTEAEFLTMVLGNELNYGLGVDIEIAPQLFKFGLELFGRTPLDKPFGTVETSSLEALFGPKWAFIRGFEFQAAAGIGLVQGRGTPDFRFLFGLQWAPGTDDEDGDGVPDAEDACPRQPEDVDGFADFDGCPDPDNDNDGIPDVKDACPMRAETFDGIDDEDGCPEAETFADRDMDGIPDDRDQCPEIPETVNGFEDSDGCRDELPPNWGQPATGPSHRGPSDPDCIVGLEDLIVHFERGSDQLSEEAKKVLFEVANKLNNNAYVKFISINGHADEEGTEVLNLKLSQARARNVKAYLAEQVVDRDKMAARGYGAFAPKVDMSNDAAYAENRRVDFTVELGGKCAGQ